MTVGEKIARRREKKRLSQLALARRVDVSVRTIQRWEADKTCPTNTHLLRLLRVLDLELEDLR